MSFRHLITLSYLYSLVLTEREAKCSGTLRLSPQYDRDAWDVVNKHRFISRYTFRLTSLAIWLRASSSAVNFSRFGILFLPVTWVAIVQVGKLSCNNSKTVRAPSSCWIWNVCHKMVVAISSAFKWSPWRDDANASIACLVDVSIDSWWKHWITISRRGVCFRLSKKLHNGMKC